MHRVHPTWVDSKTASGAIPLMAALGEEVLAHKSTLRYLDAICECRSALPLHTFFFNPVQAGRTCPKTWQGCDKEDARGQLYKRGGRE